MKGQYFVGKLVKTKSAQTRDGAGKTTLIERTVRALAPELRLGVIDGDLATQLDADRAAAAGAQAVQINTGGECDSHWR